MFSVPKKDVSNQMSSPTEAKPNVDGGEEAKTGTITIRVKDQTGEETYFKVKPHTKMSKIFTAYAERKGVNPTAFRFLLDGSRINADQTPKMVSECVICMYKIIS